MRKRWTRWRIVGAVLALLFLVSGGVCCRNSRRLARQFQEWEDARTVEMTVDLSTPGRYTAPFRQTCTSSHGAAVMLRVSPEVMSEKTHAERLAGLRARLEIVDPSSASVVAGVDAFLDEGGEPRDGPSPLFWLPSFRNGQYEARVTVTEGAPALKGAVQRLEGIYMLCGLEAIPALIAKIMGIAGFTIGGIMTAILFRILMSGRCRAVQSQPEGLEKG